MTLLQAWFWPDVSTRKNALHAIWEAYWIMVVLAAYWTVFALIGIARRSDAEFDLLLFSDPAFMAACAVGIHFKSRAAALAGFFLYVLGHFYFLIKTGRISVIFTTLVALGLLHGVRGTIAFHRFAPIPEGTPSIEKSFQAFGRKPSEVSRESKRDTRE